MAEGKVGTPIELHPVWEGYGSNVPTSATVQAWVWTGSGRSYLQSGETTMGGTPFDFPMTSLGGGHFRKSITPLLAMKGLLLEWNATPTGPLASYPSLGSDEGIKITSSDEDDLLAAEQVTQSKVDAIGASSESQLLAPASIEIPDTGTRTFVLEFILKDLDTSPVALVDPDSNQVDVAAINQGGGAPTGITLAGSPAGRMTRTASGQYTLVVTVDSTAVDDDQLRFTATYAKSAVSNVAKAMTILGDFDQLDAIQAIVQDLQVKMGTSLDVATDPSLATGTVFSKLRGIGNDTDALASLLAAIDATLTAMEGAGWTTGYASLKAIRDAIDSILVVLETGAGGSHMSPGGIGED